MSKLYRMQFSDSESDERKSNTCTEPRRSIQNLQSAALVAIGVTFAMYGAVAQAQQPAKKIPRVGILSLTPATVQKDRVEAFREALRKLGYVDGQNINIEYRYGDNKARTNARTRRRTRPSQRRCDSHDGKFSDPPCQRSNHCDSDCNDVGQRSGGLGLCPVSPVLAETTGLTNISRDLGDKRLELLKEIIPKLSRVAVFRDLTNVTEGIGVDEIEPTARVLKLQTQSFELAKVEDFDRQFQAIMKWRADGLAKALNLTIPHGTVPSGPGDQMKPAVRRKGVRQQQTGENY